MKENLAYLTDMLTLAATQGKEPIVIGPRTELMIRTLLAFQDEIEASHSGCFSFHYGRQEVQARHDRKLGYWKIES